MAKKLTLKPEFTVQVVEGEGAFLLSERQYFLLRGSLYSRLTPLLDGRYSADEIVQRLHPEVMPAKVHYALAILEKNGYLVEADHDVAATRAAFWNGIGLDAGVTERRLRECTVELAEVGAVSAEPLARALKALNVRLASEGDFAVAVTDDYLRAGLEKFNSASLASGRPWLLVKPLGTVLWIGPVFRPHQTACWECLAARLRVNRRVEYYLQQKMGSTTSLHVSRPSLTVEIQIALQLAAIETIRGIARSDADRVPMHLITLDLQTLKTQRHRVIRRPQCPRCGRQDYCTSRKAVPLRLQSQEKQFTTDGGHRTVPPEQTVANYEHHVSPITGAVTLLKSIASEQDYLIHFYIAAHASPRKTDDIHGLRHTLQEVSAGKGMTDDQARASGLCEALERYSGYFWGDEVTTRASYQRLGESAIHPNKCMLFSESQYRQREEGIAAGSTYEPVPAPLDEEAEILWTPVWSLTTGQFKYLPTEYCYAYLRSTTPSDKRYCLADSNGNGAGNTLEEAVLQGFMELIERDSVALWWYSRAHRPNVNLESFHDEYIRQLTRWYRARDRDVWVLDLTSDLQIPTFAAISRRVDKAEEDIIWGFGSHFDPRIAVMRALTELNQHLPRVWANEDLEYRAVDRNVRNWYKNAKLADYTHLAPDVTEPRVAEDYDWSRSDDLRDDVLRCQELVERQGMELLVLDQTRPEIGLPVAKVIVPGLRHFRARLGPGRLYEVPPRLGWIDQPLTEDQLNPMPYFFP